MLIKKILSLFVGAMFIFSTTGVAFAAVPETPVERLTYVEKAMYGMEQTGSLMDRVNRLERDYNGVHSSGSMMERINVVYDALCDNTNGPSTTTQLNSIEWAIMHKVSMDSIQKRVSDMELQVQGKNTEGYFKTRIESLALFAFGSQDVPLVQVNVPAATLAKIQLETPVNAKNLKVGDVIKYSASEDIIENGMLIFAKGAIGEGVVKKVVQAKNFGRNAEVNIDFNTLQAVDGTDVDTTVGTEAEAEMKNTAMAAGASIAGMIVLGPIGIIGGAFVQGKNVDLPVGTELYIQTKNDVTVYAIPTTESAGGDAAVAE